MIKQFHTHMGKTFTMSQLLNNWHPAHGMCLLFAVNQHNLTLQI